jgi:ferritin-like metal-binding protein YciE
MAEPTLKDILAAITELRSETKADIARLDAKVDAHRAETLAHRAETDAHREETTAHREETKTDIARLDAKVDAHRAETDAHRAETAKGFAALEAELEGHSDPIHKNLEADIRALHRPLLRAKIPGIPKDLPSEVRAKAARPSKPAKRTAKRRSVTAGASR